MCFLKITKYYGRYGNNILQILSMLNDYEINQNLKKYNINILDHKLFKLKNINYKNNCNCNNFILYNKLLIYNLDLIYLKQLFNKYIYFNIENNNLKNYDIVDISIHIRSGDIFNVINKSHKLYLQPPLYFYKKIIDENIYKKIKIIYENLKNPVIQILINHYKDKNNIIFKSSNVIDDIISLSNSKKIVFSNGTFCLIPFIISTTIEKIIFPDYMKNNIWYKINNNISEFIDLPNYMKEQTWCNSLFQRNIMINYIPK